MFGCRRLGEMEESVGNLESGLHLSDCPIFMGGVSARRTADLSGGGSWITVFHTISTSTLLYRCRIQLPMPRILRQGKSGQRHAMLMTVYSTGMRRAETWIWTRSGKTCVRIVGRRRGAFGYPQSSLNCGNTKRNSKPALSLRDILEGQLPPKPRARPNSPFRESRSRRPLPCCR